MILETELKQLILKMKEKKEQHEVLKVKMELEKTRFFENRKEFE